jgi:peptidoglycan/xylan/chitin deacetylase (PgdA/CDA1 family)
MEGFDPDLYLASYPFYSRNDRIFRYLRDVVLSSAAYNQIMERMMRKYRFDPSKAAEMLWMNNQHLRALDEGGHVVGLHSYSHPTVLANLAQTDQKEEYERNLGHLVRVLGSRPITMSHPCNSYSSTTLQVLSNFGIKVGFCATMDDLVDRSHLEYPRQDHANLMKEMRE